MPTENRSSNKEMVSVLHREDRYIVIKRSDLGRIPGKQRLEFSKASRLVHDRMLAAGAPARQFLVIESDWPEYELAWASIEARVLGSGAAPLTGSRLLDLHSTELRAARMEIATLRAQLAESDALLRDINKRHSSGVDFDLPADLAARVKSLSASAEPSALPDPLRCNECTHADCGKFDGPRQVECRAMADNACARPGTSS
ncbi:hypothetical protein [Pseudomonas juntendi]|uniref:Uncharacterized protein n=1 Tax=Pseudomonas juntendi TaxID=2666183 RepID=A0A7W2LK22_9PSED|nr:hypothetical protein [Pseudomonas juntendi]MBA6142298.1 hypothetical protein [Pseudomonas juntendi]UXA36988.1 hypothetical protein KZA81_15865 [Pseudomonas juntendi]